MVFLLFKWLIAFYTQYLELLVQIYASNFDGHIPFFFLIRFDSHSR
jgi:hypothetical protein